MALALSLKLSEQLERIQSEEGPQRGKCGFTGDITLSSQNDVSEVLKQLAEKTLCIDKVLQSFFIFENIYEYLKISVLSLVNVSLLDDQVVNLVKLIRCKEYQKWNTWREDILHILCRSVPSLVFDQVDFSEKHWLALASGLCDCGARVTQVLQTVSGSNVLNF